MRMHYFILVAAAICLLPVSVRADEEYDKLKARLEEATRKFYANEDELAKKVGWTDRTIAPTSEQAQAMHQMRVMKEHPRFDFLADFYKYAQAHEGRAEAMEAWAMVLTMARCLGSSDGYLEMSEVTEAFRHLAQDYAADPGIKKAMQIIRRDAPCVRLESLESLYKAIESGNSDSEIIAEARLARGRMYQYSRRYRGMGRQARAFLAADEKTAYEIFASVAIQFPDTEAGQEAEALVYRKTHMQIGQKLPEFEGKDFAGNLIRLSQYRGKVVMVVFWASWCGPCMARIPEEREIATRFAGKPFQILGVNSDRTRDAFRKVMAKEALPWRNIFDGDPKTGPIVSALRIQAFPTVFLLDHEGVIRHEGLYGDRLKTAIEDLIQKAVKAAKAEDSDEPLHTPSSLPSQ